MSLLYCCDYCLKPLKLIMQCSRCKSTYYCSADHQKKAWSLHRPACLEKKEKPEESKLIETKTNPEKMEKLRQLATSKLGQLFFALDLKSSCLGQAYLLQTVFQEYGLGEATLCKGFVEDDQYKMAWTHFFLKIGSQIYDPSTVSYWLFYESTAPIECAPKPKTTRRVVEERSTLSVKYEFKDSAEIQELQQMAFEGAKQGQFWIHVAKYRGDEEVALLQRILSHLRLFVQNSML